MLFKLQLPNLQADHHLPSIWTCDFNFDQWQISPSMSFHCRLYCLQKAICRNLTALQMMICREIGKFFSQYNRRWNLSSIERETAGPVWQHAPQVCSVADAVASGCSHFRFSIDILHCRCLVLLYFPTATEVFSTHCVFIQEHGWGAETSNNKKTFNSISSCEMFTITMLSSFDCVTVMWRIIALLSLILSDRTEHLKVSKPEISKQHQHNIAAYFKVFK